MEYGLRDHHHPEGRQAMMCLNPCFNGIWSARVRYPAGHANAGDVLILVLMEYGLRVARMRIAEM